MIQWTPSVISTFDYQPVTASTFLGKVENSFPSKHCFDLVFPDLITNLLWTNYLGWCNEFYYRLDLNLALRLGIVTVSPDFVMNNGDHHWTRNTLFTENWLPPSLMLWHHLIRSSYSHIFFIYVLLWGSAQDLSFGFVLTGYPRDAHGIDICNAGYWTHIVCM